MNKLKVHSLCGLCCPGEWLWVDSNGNQWSAKTIPYTDDVQKKKTWLEIKKN